MPRRSKRELEQALDGLADADTADDRVFVACIGGDQDTPTGWLTPEEYAEHYGEPPENGFEFDVESVPVPEEGQ